MTKQPVYEIEDTGCGVFHLHQRPTDQTIPDGPNKGKPQTIIGTFLSRHMAVMMRDILEHGLIGEIHSLRADIRDLLAYPEFNSTLCRLANALEYAWSIICNAGGGDWKKESPDWQHAAAKLREDYNRLVPVMIRITRDTPAKQSPGTIAASWDNKPADIKADIAAISKKFREQTGYPIKHVVAGENCAFQISFRSWDAAGTRQWSVGAASEPDAHEKIRGTLANVATVLELVCDVDHRIADFVVREHWLCQGGTWRPATTEEVGGACKAELAATERAARFEGGMTVNQRLPGVSWFVALFFDNNKKIPLSSYVSKSVGELRERINKSESDVKSAIICAMRRPPAGSRQPHEYAVLERWKVDEVGWRSSWVGATGVVICQDCGHEERKHHPDCASLRVKPSEQATAIGSKCCVVVCKQRGTRGVIDNVNKCVGLFCEEHAAIARAELPAQPHEQTTPSYFPELNRVKDKVESDVVVETIQYEAYGQQAPDAKASALTTAKFALACLKSARTRDNYQRVGQYLEHADLPPELKEEMKAALYDWRTANGIV